MVVLLLVYFGTSYAVLPMAVWSLRVLAGQLGNVAVVVARTMPVLLLFSIFMFPNAEMWKVSAEIPTPFFLGVVALFVALGSGFLVLRLPHDVGARERFESWAAVRDTCLGTAAATAVPTDDQPLTEPVPLRRTERVNIALMLFVSQGLQALLVSHRHRLLRSAGAVHGRGCDVRAVGRPGGGAGRPDAVGVRR